MADTKRTRRSSQDKWQADLQTLEAKVNKAHEHYLALQKEYEELKKNPPKSKTRIRSTEAMIKALSSDPTTLCKILNEAGDDKDKLKQLLSEAINNKNNQQ